VLHRLRVQLPRLRKPSSKINIFENVKIKIPV
jgi:hypothetical protein